ncbi:hypothetical protein BH18THE2_BH18THE2_11870 [soil metagenome]
MALYFRLTYRVSGQTMTRLALRMKYVDEVDLELGVCPPIHSARNKCLTQNFMHYASDLSLESYPAKFDSEATRTKKDVF